MKRKILARLLLSTLWLSAVSGILLCAPAQAPLFWEADVSRGTSVFGSLERAPGNITETADPLGLYGSVYRYDTWDDPSYAKERCESKGTRRPDGTSFRVSLGGTYYIGWREMWDPMPTNGSWVAFFQMHGYGPPGQGAPLVLRCVNGDGNLYLQNNVNGTNVNFWSTPFRTGEWQTFVLHVHMAIDDTGWVELWHNGTRQTFINGQTRYNCPTWDNKDGSYNEFKWGVYRSGSLNGSGDASTFMSRARIADTYAAADPNDYYKIVDRNSGKVPAVQSASLDNGAPVILWSFGTAQNDQWQFVPTDGGYYRLLNRKSGKSLAVEGASTADGARVIQWSFGSAQNDQWKPIPIGGGYYNLQNRHSGLMLDVKGASTTNGTQFQQYHSNGGLNQQFQLTPLP